MSGPNLLVIHTDQLNSSAIGAYGGGVVQTPHIDRIAREGAMFTNFFTNSAFCTPSRGCFVTGRYPHNHGAYTNNIPLNRTEVTYAQVLKGLGYATGYSGKWHLDGNERPGWVHEERSMGFTDCRYMFNRGHWKKIEHLPMGGMQPTVYPYKEIGDEKTYTTDWLTGKTEAFIQDHKEEPFCYMVSFPDPHPPCESRGPYGTMFDPKDMSVPRTFSEKNLPAWAEALRKRGPYALEKPDREETLRKMEALYYGEVKLIDDCVGRLLACLKSQGILDNTVVVFTTDHGEYMGEHGLHEKNHLYETAYRIPLVVRWPGKIPAGTVVDKVVSTVDFQPSILHLMGAPTSGREQGKDASPFMQGKKAPWADEAFMHHSSLERAGIFTDGYELALVKEGGHILFDRKADSWQERNLFDDPGHRGVVAELARRIEEHHRETGSPALPWIAGIVAPLAGQAAGQAAPPRPAPSVQRPFVSVPVRYIKMRDGSGVDAEEPLFDYAYADWQIDPRTAAFVLVDFWTTHIIASHLARCGQIIRGKIAPLLHAARGAGFLVIHTPGADIAAKYPQFAFAEAKDDSLAASAANQTGPTAKEAEAQPWPPEEFRKREGPYSAWAKPIFGPETQAKAKELHRVRLIPEEVGPEPGDLVIPDGAELHRVLGRRGILHIFYLGFASNDCMLHKDYAIVAMRRRGYNAMLVRDCTTGIEAARSFGNLSATEMAIQYIEFHNATTSSFELIRACGGSENEARSTRGGRTEGAKG